MKLPVFITLFAMVCPLTAAIPTAPTGLLTNGIANPQAIDVGSPVFSWVMNNPDRGESQAAWQAVVSSGSSVVWDSGKTSSPHSSSVPYAGPTLAPATRYTWKVKLWDKDDNESPLSTECHLRHGAFQGRLDRLVHLGWHIKRE